MDYRFVVMDLDDTILNSSESINEYTLRVIERLKGRGVVFTLATGRTFSSARPYAEELNIEVPIITYNGAYIRSPEAGEPLYHRPLDIETARSIIFDAEKRGLHINFYQNDQLYVAEMNSKIRWYESIAGIKARAVGKISEFISQPPTKLLLIIDDRDRHQYFLKYFLEKYPQLEIVESKPNLIEFDAPGVNKGKALEIVADHLDVDKEKSIGIGDSGNDLALIKEAGLGIAMGNAPDKLKRVADMVAGDHNDNGAARIMEEIFASCEMT